MKNKFLTSFIISLISFSFPVSSKDKVLDHLDYKEFRPVHYLNSALKTYSPKKNLDNKHQKSLLKRNAQKSRSSILNGEVTQKRILDQAIKKKHNLSSKKPSPLVLHKKISSPPVSNQSHLDIIEQNLKNTQTMLSKIQLDMHRNTQKEKKAVDDLEADRRKMALFNEQKLQNLYQKWKIEDQEREKTFIKQSQENIKHISDFYEKTREQSDKKFVEAEKERNEKYKNISKNMQSQGQSKQDQIQSRVQQNKDATQRYKHAMEEASKKMYGEKSQREKVQFNQNKIAQDTAKQALENLKIQRAKERQQRTEYKLAPKNLSESLEIFGFSATHNHKTMFSQIKKKYRELSLKYHPDRPGGDEEKFKVIREAYERISNAQ